MKCAKLVGSLLALSALLAPGVAHAQIFSVYVQPEAAQTTTPGKDAPRFRRLQIGSYLALWDQPPVQNLPVVVSSVSGGRARRIGLDVDTGASPLITADYFITRRLSVGGWWNPIRGTAEVDRGELRRRFGSVPVGQTDFDFYDNFFDVHAAWHLPDRVGFLPRFLTSGVVVQVGYSVQNIDLDAPQGRNVAIAFGQPGQPVGADFGETRTSANAWVTKSFNLGTPFRGRPDRPISLFVSGGHYFSEDFDNAWNIMGGVTFTLSERLSISGSYWRVLPEDGDDQSRFSIGVVGRY